MECLCRAYISLTVQARLAYSYVNDEIKYDGSFVLT